MESFRLQRPLRHCGPFWSGAALLWFSTLFGACDPYECPDGTPDDLYIIPTTELDIAEVRGDSRVVGDYGQYRANGVLIGYLFQHPDLDTDSSARNEWIGHFVFEWPTGDTSRDLTLTVANCRFVVDGEGSYEREVEGSMDTIQNLPGYACDGTATRESSGKDVSITFDSRLVKDGITLGRNSGEYTLEYRKPVCGGLFD